METLGKYFKITLTDEQEQLLNRILAFINSDKKVFILKGYAGTGKTTIMHGLVKYFGENKIPFTLMASTGRAAKVMAEKARFPAATVHGTIYVLHIVEMPRQGEKSDDANFRISFKMKMPNMNKKRVFFIDESSMLSNHLQKGENIASGSGRLLDDLFSHTGKGKVVFIGDQEQLGVKIKKAGILFDIVDVFEQAPSKKALIKSIAYNNMQTDPYLNALRVKYGYANTCHKAQGSEWPQVYSHLEKSMFYLDKENQHHWAYTALSRAEEKIHILNNICLY